MADSGHTRIVGAMPRQPTGSQQSSEAFKSLDRKVADFKREVRAEAQAHDAGSDPRVQR